MNRIYLLLMLIILSVLTSSNSYARLIYVLYDHSSMQIKGSGLNSNHSGMTVCADVNTDQGFIVKSIKPITECINDMIVDIQGPDCQIASETLSVSLMNVLPPKVIKKICDKYAAIKTLELPKLQVESNCPTQQAQLQNVQDATEEMRALVLEFWTKSGGGLSGNQVLLGKGATKRVFKDQVQDKSFAFWRHKVDLSTKDGISTVARLKHELEIQREISGAPYIVQQYHIQEDEKLIQSSFEAFDGALSSHVKYPEQDGKITEKELKSKKPPLTITHATELAHQLCGAINYIHSKNIVHRDIKPENIFYRIKDNHLQVGLGDLDQAYKKGEEYTHTEHFNPLGTTPMYASPDFMGQTLQRVKPTPNMTHEELRQKEEVENQIFEVDRRHDHWGAGMALLNVISGESAPWQRGAQFHTVYGIVNCLHNDGDGWVKPKKGCDPVEKYNVTHYINHVLSQKQTDSPDEVPKKEQLKALLNCSLSVKRENSDCFSRVCSQIKQ